MTLNDTALDLVTGGMATIQVDKATTRQSTGDTFSKPASNPISGQVVAQMMNTVPSGSK